MNLVTTSDSINVLIYIMIEIEDITTLDNLNEAFYECASVCKWKESVQRYTSNMLLNNIHLQEELRNGSYKLLPTTNFNLTERGKIRKIEAPQMRDRIVQKILMKNILLPRLTPKLIYDNYASLHKRGTSMARARIDVMLRRYMRHHGNDGYILLIDIRKYFENIDHEILKSMIRKDIVGVSEDVFKLIEYIIDNSSKDSKGLNLGSENPQIYAVYYLYRLDNFIKIVKGMKYYGRYMDDMYVISDNKEELKTLLADIKRILGELGLEINKRKTHIVKLSHGFTYLQTKYSLVGNKIIKRLTPKKIIREKRRLKAFKRLEDKGRMKCIDILNCYMSWRGSSLKSCSSCNKSIRSIDALYKHLFGNKKPPNQSDDSRKQLIVNIYQSASADELMMSNRINNNLNYN